MNELEHNTALGGDEDARELKENCELRGQNRGRVEDSIDVKQLGWLLGLPYTRPTLTSKGSNPSVLSTNAGLSEYGLAKFGVTPDGGERAGTRSLRLLLLIMLYMLTVKDAVQCHTQVNPPKNVENSWFCSFTEQFSKLSAVCTST